MSWRNPDWKYVPSTSTNILPTLKRHGFRPTTDAERAARQRRAQKPPANVTHLSTQKKSRQT